MNRLTEFQCKPSAEANLFGYAKAQPEIMKSEALNNHQITNKPMTFEQAIQQLEALTAKLEKGDVDLAQLSEEIKRAQELIVFCKAQLGQVQQDVENLTTSAE